MRHSSSKISKHTKEVSVVELGRSSNKLTQNVNNMRNVRTRDPKVDYTTNKVTIASQINKGFTISGS